MNKCHLSYYQVSKTRCRWNLLALLYTLFAIILTGCSPSSITLEPGTRHYIIERNPISVTWTGSEPYSPWDFEKVTCIATEGSLNRANFENYAADVYGWLLEAETVAGLRIVCRPRGLTAKAKYEF